MALTTQSFSEITLNRINALMEVMSAVDEDNSIVGSQELLSFVQVPLSTGKLAP